MEEQGTGIAIGWRILDYASLVFSALPLAFVVYFWAYAAFVSVPAGGRWPRVYFNDISSLSWEYAHNVAVFLLTAVLFSALPWLLSLPLLVYKQVATIRYRVLAWAVGFALIWASYTFDETGFVEWFLD